MKTRNTFPQSMKGVVRDFFRQEVFRRRTVHITPADYEKISSLIELDILDQECMADEGLTQTISVQGCVDVPLSTRGYDISVAYTAELTVTFTRNYFPEWGVYETVLHDREISDFSVASAEVWDCLAEEEASSDFDKNLIKIR
jgi:hypothetical protein